MSIRTRLCDLLNIKYPILQGGMAWVATAELVAAVSEAGGLGIIGSGQASPQWVHEQVRKVKSLTDKPFGVNVMLLSPYAEAIINLLAEEKVALVTTGAGNPGKYLNVLRDAGVKVIPVVSSVALAKRLSRTGVDALIAEGMESGGHVGEITTMVLLPQVIDAVDVPVIAAGGIYDGRGMAAALMFGAEGIQMGTRFICASECVVHERIKKMIIKAKDRASIVTGSPTGHPVRVLKNKLTKLFEELEVSGGAPEDFEKLGVGRMKLAMVDGDTDMGSVMAGQVAAMVRQIEPAGEIIQSVVEEAEKIIAQIYNSKVVG